VQGAAAVLLHALCTLLLLLLLPLMVVVKVFCSGRDDTML
jgi:hypothetical protein